ncbi:MAG TPA: PspC domain-containing protein [Gammaproteobacteria bacterium]|nr:PspC domain-containing protein [Gammaproteobacteria bacterium]
MSTGVNSMYLDREKARWLGVCAGIASWLDIPATLVRIVFVICVISWPPFLLGYFILYFCLDKDLTPEKVQDYFSDAPTAEHFRKLNYRKPIYKNERNKRIAGVCSGIADYLEVSAFSVRCVTLCSMFIFGPFTFWAYVICWFVFDPDPYIDDGERYERKMRRRQRKSERRAERHARRKARKVRKSYANEEVKAGMDDLEADIHDVVNQVHDELRTEIDDAMSGFKSKTAGRRSKASADQSRAKYSPTECTELYSTMEKRLQDIEAYMTSKQFRLHCQLNRI